MKKIFSLIILLNIFLQMLSCPSAYATNRPITQDDNLQHAKIQKTETGGPAQMYLTAEQVNLPEDIIIYMLRSCPGFALATGTVCKRLEWLRSNYSDSLVRKFDTEQDFETFCESRLYPKLGVKLKFAPTLHFTGTVSKVFPHLMYYAPSISFISKLSKAFPNLIYLDLQGCEIDDEPMKAMALELSKLTALSHLNISDNYIEGDSIKNLATSLEKMTRIKHLNFSQCFLDDNCKILLTILNKMSHLTYLDFQGNGINHDLIQILGGITQLRHLNLSRNMIDNDDLAIFGPVLGKMTNLIHLNLYCVISDVYNRYKTNIASSLANLTNLENLQFLDLSYNSVDNDTIRLLAFHLSKLQTFKIASTDIRFNNNVKIENSLGILITLRSLDLSTIYIDNEDDYKELNNLAAELSQLKGLEWFEFNDNGIDDKGICYLVPALGKLEYLQTLNLTSNDISDLGIVSLTTELIKLRHFRILDLDHNKIGDQGLVSLINNLSSIGSLEEVSLHGNDNISDWLKKNVPDYFNF